MGLFNLGFVTVFLLYQSIHPRPLLVLILWMKTGLEQHFVKQSLSRIGFCLLQIPRFFSALSSSQIVVLPCCWGWAIYNSKHLSGTWIIRVSFRGVCLCLSQFWKRFPCGFVCLWPLSLKSVFSTAPWVEMRNPRQTHDMWLAVVLVSVNLDSSIHVEETRNTRAAKHGISCQPSK